VPPPKGASFEDKLGIIPPLPKGRKPILKKRTLAEVLVLGLAKTNNLPNRPHADELKELDIDSRGLQGPEERDRIMLLHTKSDTNLLRPAIGRAVQPSSPSDEEAPTPRRPTRRVDRSTLSTSTKGSISPPPHDAEAGPKKRVGFNAYVSQCIAVTPEERSSDDEDEASSDALSMKSGGSISGRASTSRSNSHSSARSDHLIIAPMAPTLLKETRTEEEQLEGPALVYMPIDSPFDSKDSDDEEFEFGTVIKVNSPPDNRILSDVPEGGAADLGGEYNISSKKRKLSAGETPPPRRQYRGSEGEPKPDSTQGPRYPPQNPTTNEVTNTTDVVPVGIAVDDDSRGRTLHRVSSSSSLNERSRSRNGSSPLGGESPESSRASSVSTRGSSTDMGLTGRTGRGVTRADFKNGKSSPGSIAEDTEDVMAVVPPESQVTDESTTSQQDSIKPVGAMPATRQESSGFVDKAVANARGLIGTLLNGPSSTGNAKWTTN
jgi:hypothetical protein